MRRPQVGYLTASDRSHSPQKRHPTRFLAWPPGHRIPTSSITARSEGGTSLCFTVLEVKPPHRLCGYMKMSWGNCSVRVSWPCRAPGLIQAALAGQTTNREGAGALQLSVRQFQRLKARVRLGGPLAVRWLDSWSGIGVVAVGMHRQGFDLQLTRYDERWWRATFYTTGMEHSPTGATGTAPSLPPRLPRRVPVQCRPPSSTPSAPRSASLESP